MSRRIRTFGAGFSLWILGLARTKSHKTEEAPEKWLCSVILSEAKNLSSIQV
jgi:hypothetical protein